MLVQNRPLAHTRAHANISGSSDIHSTLFPAHLQNSDLHWKILNLFIRRKILLLGPSSHALSCHAFKISSTWLHEPQSHFSPPSTFSFFLSCALCVPPSPTLSVEFHVSSHQICTHTEQVRIWLLSLLLKLDGFSMHLLHTCILS